MNKVFIPTKVKNLRIPYMGSKQAIAFEIVLAMKQRHPSAKFFYDVFGGGGAISFMALQFGYKVFYNEKDTGVFNLLNFLIKNKIPQDWYNWVSRKEFKDCLLKDDPRSQMIKSCWSFGNSGTAYLYGVPIEDDKRLAHDIVVNKSIESLDALNKKYNIQIPMPKGDNLNIRRINFCLYIKKRLSHLSHLSHLEHITRLQHFNNISNMNNIKGSNITVSNLSYENIEINTPQNETIVYCDPPYRGTKEYIEDGFNHKEFDKWFKDLKYPAYMSEYSAPFNIVFSQQKRALLNNSVENKKIKKENLYYNDFKI